MSRRRDFFGRITNRVEYALASAAADVAGADPVETEAAVDPAMAVLIEENQKLEASRQWLQEAWNKEGARVTALQTEAAGYREQIAKLQARNEAMETRARAAEDHVDGSCADAREVRRLNAALASMQKRLTLLQDANEAHDRWAAGQVAS